MSENLTNSKPLAIKTMRGIPHKGEAFISVLLSDAIAPVFQKANFLMVADAARSLNVDPEIVMLEFKNRTEIHALFYYLKTDDQEELDQAFKGKFKALCDTGIPSKAIRSIRNSHVQVVAA